MSIRRSACPSRVAGRRGRRPGRDRGGDRTAPCRPGRRPRSAGPPAVGCSVTLKWRTRRRWCASTTRTKRTRQCAVGTVKTSIATRSRTWLVRTVRQVCDGGVRRFGIRRETGRSATSIPSFRSSPWILGAPHSRFASPILVTRAVISALTGGRPPVGRPESFVQCSRMRRRRHRSTVSGATIMRASLHPVHILDSQIQKSRSLLRSFGRLAVLLYTASCWRRARFSRARCRWPSQRNGKSRSRWSSVLVMEGDCLRIRAERSTAYPRDGVLAKDRREFWFSRAQRERTLGQAASNGRA